MARAVSTPRSRNDVIAHLGDAKKMTEDIVKAL